MDIKWSVGISYSDITNKRLFASYMINARNKDIAEDIAKELFIMEYGVNSSIDIVIEPEHLSSEDMRGMLSIKNNIFEKLCTLFRGKTYKEFTIAFQQFGGFSAHLSTFSDSYFWLNFMGLTVKAIYKVNGDCYLDTKEIYYTDEFNKKIVARNNWTEYYYCI